MGHSVSQRGLARRTPVVTASLTAPECEVLPVPAPQCRHSPDSGRPPVEQPPPPLPAPGGRPDTTTSVDQRSGADLDVISSGIQFPCVQLPLISAEAAGKALCEYFLANADRGDNAANDELVDALVRRIRAQRTSSDGGP